MSWHQQVQDAIERRGFRRFALWIFRKRVQWYARSGRIRSARIQDQ